MKWSPSRIQICPKCLTLVPFIHYAAPFLVITAQGICIYTPPIEHDDEAGTQHARVLMDAIPFSIIGSTEDVRTPDGRTVKGHEYSSELIGNC